MGHLGHNNDTLHTYNSNGVKLVKFFLFLITLTFMILGIIIMIRGFIFLFSDESYLKFLSNNKSSNGYYNALGYMVLVVGFLMTIVYFLGCCGACGENSCMLNTFAGLMTLVIILKIAITVLFFGYSRLAKEIVTDAMKDGLDKYLAPSHKFYTLGWDTIQMTYKCCGIENYTDWKNTPFHLKTGKEVPSSCCDTTHDASCVTTKIYHDGCIEKFQSMLTENLYTFGIISAVIVVIQFITIITAFHFGRKAKMTRNLYSMLSIKRYSPC